MGLFFSLFKTELLNPVLMLMVVAPFIYFTMDCKEYFTDWIFHVIPSNPICWTNFWCNNDV